MQKDIPKSDIPSVEKPHNQAVFAMEIAGLCLDIILYFISSNKKREERVLEKEFFKRIEILKDTPRRITLTYYLLEGNISEEYCDLKIYGALVEKEVMSKSGRIMREKKSIPDLFFTKGEAKMFLERISKEKVMPIDLKCAVKPYVDEQIRLKSVESV